MKILKFYIAILISGPALAQDILNPDAFLDLVYQNHPMARQADLKLIQAQSSVLASKGAFDPIFQFSNENKTFDGVNYFNHLNPELKIQTRLGLTVKTGIEKSSGYYLNPELTNGSMTYLGIEMPILQGLLLDKERAELRKAEIYRQQSDEVRRSMLNDLVLDALGSYWEWTGTYAIQNIYSNNLENAERRFLLIKNAFENGDRSMMDTLEAYTQLQNIQLQKNEADLAFALATVDLGRYLWNDSGKPALPQSGIIPGLDIFRNFIATKIQDSDLNFLVLNHPDLKQYFLKIEALKVNKDLKFQYLLPKANLKLNLLGKDAYRFENTFNQPFNNNYKFGFDFKIPLALREGRGEFNLAKLKIQESVWQYDQKKWDIENKIRTQIRELEVLQNQLILVSTMSDNYKRLLSNEEFKFQQGESSLFLINSRENKLLDNLKKEQETRIKFIKAWYKQQWAAAAFAENI